ncbi:MAG: hypothetical protein AAGE18_06895 [Pseudomonadota bacterium]
MRPTLDDLELPQVQTLKVSEARALAEHRAPEMAGSYLQNLGRNPATVTLAGVASGPEALTFLETLNGKFTAGDPLTFFADIVTDAEIEQVLIVDFQTREVAGTPERMAYGLVLREFLEAEEPEELGLLQSDLLEDADSLIDELVEGLDLFPAFETGLERFVGPLGSLLERLQNANRGS